MKFFILSVLALKFINSADAVFSTPPLDSTGGTSMVDAPRPGCFQLTPKGQGGYFGEVWASEKIDISKPFEIEVNIYVGDKKDASDDGIAFVLQNNALSNALLGNLGYLNIFNSFIIELDTFNSQVPELYSDIPEDHIQMRSNGPPSSSGSQLTDLTSASDGKLDFSIDDDNEHSFKVAWDGSTMEVAVDGKNYLSQTFSGGLAQYVGGSNQVYYGFTSSTHVSVFNGGEGGTRHYVCQSHPTEPVFSAPPLDTMRGDTIVDTPRSSCFELTPKLQSIGAVWASQQIDISKPFEIENYVYVGENDSSNDGIAFVLQYSSLSPSMLGGDFMGYGRIENSLVVELDTHNNGVLQPSTLNINDIPEDHVQIRHIGSQPQGWPRIDLTSPSEGKLDFNIEDNIEHSFKITWDGLKLAVAVDGTNYLSKELPGGLAQYTGGNTLVWYGYTSASGSLWHVLTRHYVCQSPAAVVSCDPHFRTWTGEKFDFHGVCDLVLLQSPNLNIHIRTKKTRSWSFVHSVALHIGKDILEVVGGAWENYFWLNKVRGDASKPIALDHYNVTFNKLSPKSRQFVVDLGMDGQIDIKTWNGMVSVSIDGGKLFDGSLGLMGSYPTGKKLARDGKTIIEDVDAFGQEWQVKSTESMLFHNVDGPQHPVKCDIPSVAQLRRRLEASVITKADAMIACSRVDEEDFDLCVFDVMATNDKDAAGAY